MVTIQHIENAGPKHRARRLILSDAAFQPIVTSAAVVRMLSLAEGDDLDRDELSAALAEAEAECARTRALYLLGYRDRSHRELVTHLTDDGYSEALAAEIARRMTELGYVDDVRFAHSWVRTRTAAGIGPVRVRRELRDKGISDAVAEATLAEAAEVSDPVQAARVLLGNLPLSSRADRERALRRLVRRGFDVSCALQALSLATTDELDSEHLRIDENRC